MPKPHLLLPLATLLLSQTRPAHLINPGSGAGPVTRTATEQSLLQSLGKLATREAVDIGEGIDEPGLVLYPSDPTRRWKSPSPKTDRPILPWSSSAAPKPTPPASGALPKALASGQLSGNSRNSTDAPSR
jgi:hypothetical protein